MLSDIVGSSAEPVGKPWPVFGHDFKFHTPIKVVMAPDFKRSEVDPTQPYIVRGLDTKFADPHLQGTINLWISGFDNAPAVRSKGKSQWPLGDSGATYDKLMSFGPESLDTISDTDSNWNKALKTFHVWGCSGVLQSSGTETHSLGSVKFTSQGKREVVVANVHAIREYIKDEVDPGTKLPSTVDIANTIKNLSVAQLEALRARNTLLFHGEVRAGDLFYQPAGTWIAERAVDAGRCFGIRCSTLPKVDKESDPAKGIQALIDCSSPPADAPGAEPSDLSKFLAAVKTAMTAVAVAAPVEPGATAVKT